MELLSQRNLRWLEGFRVDAKSLALFLHCLQQFLERVLLTRSQELSAIHDVTISVTPIVEQRAQVIHESTNSNLRLNDLLWSLECFGHSIPTEARIHTTKV